MAYRSGVWVGVCALLGACSSSESGNDAGGGTDSSAGNDSAASSDTGTAQDTGTNPDSGSGNDSGGGGSCTQANVNSACGVPQAIVRVLVSNGLGSATGTLRTGINHYRLGSGGTGGVPHTETSLANQTVGASATQINFDMCAGGAMWSEEDCEFSLWAYVDKNNNMQVDPGEPAGKTVVSVSCHAAGQQCYSVTLSCMAGSSCLAFSDPGACKCTTPSCPTPQQLKFCQ